MQELKLREDKEAGAKVKELSEQSLLHSCVSIDLEYGYHGGAQIEQGFLRFEQASMGVSSACRSVHECKRADCACAVVDETLAIIGRDATELAALNLNACQASRSDDAAAMSP